MILSKGDFMAVKPIETDNGLILEFDNGDFIKLKRAMEKWNFKDYQGLTRFVVSILELSEDKKITIKTEGQQQDIYPVQSLLK